MSQVPPQNPITPGFEAFERSSSRELLAVRLVNLATRAFSSYTSKVIPRIFFLRTKPNFKN